MDVWVGLAARDPEPPYLGSEVVGDGYARIPATLSPEAAPSIYLANLDTIEFNLALSDWGPVSGALIYDAPTDGTLLAFCPLVGTTAVGFGVGGWGLYGYATFPGIRIISMYDRPRIEAGELQWDGAHDSGHTFDLRMTFSATALCSAGTWAPPGPFARAA